MPLCKNRAFICFCSLCPIDIDICHLLGLIPHLSPNSEGKMGLISVSCNTDSLPPCRWHNHDSHKSQISQHLWGIHRVSAFIPCGETHVHLLCFSSHNLMTWLLQLFPLWKLWKWSREGLGHLLVAAELKGSRHGVRIRETGTQRWWPHSSFF